MLGRSDTDVCFSKRVAHTWSLERTVHTPSQKGVYPANFDELTEDVQNVPGYDAQNYGIWMAKWVCASATSTVRVSELQRTSQNTVGVEPLRLFQLRTLVNCPAQRLRAVGSHG